MSPGHKPQKIGSKDRNLDKQVQIPRISCKTKILDNQVEKTKISNMTSRDQKFFVAGAEFHRFLSPYQKLNSFYHQVEISTLGYGSMSQNSHYRFK